MGAMGDIIGALRRMLRDAWRFIRRALVAAGVLPSIFEIDPPDGYAYVGDGDCGHRPDSLDRYMGEWGHFLHCRTLYKSGPKPPNPKGDCYLVRRPIKGGDQWELMPELSKADPAYEYRCRKLKQL
jgi:hypothetical protein